ncbi:CDP-alcohol phosphatidyltransferase family protein [Nocardiopsis lambiniae]|uniref:CDP-alcohol phosphatidyltransferase family protein n=1 Tax=Nocardiopsis lambiniae TaxID=3075539 RepID=A0ABU2M555_9ACTN|nr:CDP-alcohol phosphatidyltransferase family protein [Nocardiopsis sp. DSM 44743]MDT0327742.1 CDP-alcohol phosphatidyltransferase family protein [Nocardiopsis sp. DSM 44743]
MPRFTFAQVKEETYKAKDAWWTVFLVDPLAGRLVVWTANRTDITPNQLTAGAGILGLLSAVGFAMPASGIGAEWVWLVAGALLFHLSFVLDCMDGKIARLKGTGSVFGTWVDFVFDRIRFFMCVMALLVGQWIVTGQAAYLIAAPVIVFFDLLRYLNGSQVAKTRRGMNRSLAELVGDTDRLRADAAAGPGDASPEDDAMSDAPGRVDAPAPRGIYGRARAFLLRHRVRPHLFSGIEYEMFLCVVAPITILLSLFTPVHSLILPIAVFSILALGFFEVVLVYRLWKDTRRFEERRRELIAAGAVGAGATLGGS